VPVDGANVRVTLLGWIAPNGTNPDDSSTWFAGAVPWAAAVNDVLNSDPDATAWVLPGGWVFAEAEGTRRKTLTGQTIDPLRPGIATFDVDLTGVPNDGVVLLVAVVRANADIALTPDTLENMALWNREVAIRSVRVTR
jgi:hypothetical protein